MYQHYEEADECRRDGDSDNNLVFSSSYGPGCGFDENIVSFPSQLFAYASDRVFLFSDIGGSCLTERLSLDKCEVGVAPEWTYIFRDNGAVRAGQLFYVDDGGMKCLTRSADTIGAVLTLAPCQSWISVESTQSWDYDNIKGYINVADEEDVCLLYNLTTRRAELGSCTENSASARWSQYSECRLNSRRNTGEMKLELTSSEPGQCIRADGGGLIGCDNAAAGVWQYHYDPPKSEKARLELRRGLVTVNPGDQCLGRVQLTPEQSQAGGALSAQPTGLIPCHGGEDTSTFAYWNMIIDGPEGDIFTWKDGVLTDDDADDTTYCINVLSDKQQQCPEDLRDVQTWRRYPGGEAVDATEISVKPSLLLQEISDPELLYQLFLFSAEGKQSRILRAKAAGLSRDVEAVVPAIGMARVVIAESEDLITTVRAPLTFVSDRINDGEKFFKIFSTILAIFEPLPYVGPVVKATRFKPITKQVAKRLKSGSKGLDKVEKKMGVAITPIQSFTQTLSRVLDSLEDGISILNGMVEFVTKTLFCAFQDGLTEEYERLKKWVGKLLQAVGTAGK
jgi:hypothetical protein